MRRGIMNGRVADYDRIEFYRQYLMQVLRARNEGVNVGGYFAWSFTDNFEWVEGYNQRFGMVYVDYATQKRTVKASGLWYKSFLESQDAGVHSKSFLSDDLAPSLVGSY